MSQGREEDTLEKIHTNTLDIMGSPVKSHVNSKHKNRFPTTALNYMAVL